MQYAKSHRTRIGLNRGPWNPSTLDIKTDTHIPLIPTRGFRNANDDDDATQIFINLEQTSTLKLSPIIVKCSVTTVDKV